MSRFVLVAMGLLLGCRWQLDAGEVCVPESDASFCTRLGKQCDSFSGTDNCGAARTAACGQCKYTSQVCGGRGIPNVCEFLGVGWKSGAGTADPAAFAEWRYGLPVAVLSTWNSKSSWEELEAVESLGDFAGWNGLLEMSIAEPLTPDDTGDLATCATGAYRSHQLAVAKVLKDAGWGDAYVRLGWQSNDVCRWCPKVGEEAHWKACFEDAASAFKEVSKDFRILWDMDRRFSGDVTRLWPNDDSNVDIVAVDFYDDGLTTPELWSADAASSDGDGPRGLDTWVTFATLHGKKLAIPEWGIAGNDPSVGDNSFFVDKMYEFFWLNAPILEFEAIFNLGSFQLFPASAEVHPQSGAHYRERFRLTASP